MTERTPLEHLAAATAAQRALVGLLRETGKPIRFTSVHCDAYGELTIQLDGDDPAPWLDALDDCQWASTAERASATGRVYRTRKGTWLGVDIRFVEQVIPPAAGESRG